jgi:hypothetical protein
MNYALIKNDVVANVIVADAEFVAGIADQWDHIEPATDGVGPGWGWDGSQFAAPPPVVVPEPEAEPPVWEWYIDIGPFTDRLGMASAAIDLSTEPGVIVIRNDLARRKWVDLKDQRVIAALWYLAGQAHPALGTLAVPLLTAAVVTSTLSAPVAEVENLALRKLYFS